LILTVGFAWFYHCVWFGLVLSVYVWFYLVLLILMYCSARSSVYLYGSAWSCQFLTGSAWFCFYALPMALLPYFLSANIFPPVLGLFYQLCPVWYGLSGFPFPSPLLPEVSVSF
jgi:hypothetical protein